MMLEVSGWRDLRVRRIENHIDHLCVVAKDKSGAELNVYIDLKLLAKLNVASLKRSR